MRIVGRMLAEPSSWRDVGLRMDKGQGRKMIKTVGMKTKEEEELARGWGCRISTAMCQMKGTSLLQEDRNLGMLVGHIWL